MARLENKVALISGGARGMGAAEARIFAREGAVVVIGDVGRRAWYLTHLNRPTVLPQVPGPKIGCWREPALEHRLPGPQ